MRQFLAFCCLLATCWAQSTIHTFCPLEVSCTWTSTQTFPDLITSSTPVVDVRSKGADCTGVSNSATALSNTLIAASLLGGTALIPNGCTVLVNSAVTFPDAVVTLEGKGIGSVIKAGAAMTAILQKTSQNFVFGSRVANLSLDGNVLATNLINFANGKGWALENIYGVRPANGGTGFLLGDSNGANLAFYEAKVDGIHLEFDSTDYPVAANVPVYGIHLQATATDNQISKVTVKNPLTAGYFDEGGNNQISMSHVYGFPATAYFPSYAFILGNGGQGTQLYSDSVTVAGVKMCGSSISSLTSSFLFWPSDSPVSGAYPVEVCSGVQQLNIVGNFSHNFSGISNFVHYDAGFPPGVANVFANLPNYEDVDFINHLDQTLTMRLDAGLTADQNINLRWQQRGTTKFIEQLASGGNYNLQDAANSFAFRFIVAPGDKSELNSMGTGAVQFNFRSGAGTGGVSGGNGAGAATWSITGPGLGTFNSGIKAGSSGSTIADTRELIQSTHSCGTTATCSNTANGQYREVFGSVALTSASPSTATITGINPAFTSSSTYVCTATPQGATAAIAAGGIAVSNVSGSSFTLTGPNTVTTVVNFDCKGN